MVGQDAPQCVDGAGELTGPLQLGELVGVVHDPDPKSRVGYTRVLGYSPRAGFVLTVIIDPEDWSGVTAWKTRGTDLREYLEGKEAH